MYSYELFWKINSLCLRVPTFEMQQPKIHTLYDHRKKTCSLKSVKKHFKKFVVTAVCKIRNHKLNI